MVSAAVDARHGAVVLRPIAAAQGPDFAFTEFGQLPVVFDGA
jgi:hypothetical protein